MRSHRDRLMPLLDAAFSAAAEMPADLYPVPLLRMIEMIRSSLYGDDCYTHYVGLLKSGAFPFGSDNRPVLLLNGRSEIRFYEPWRLALRHIASPRATLEEARDGCIERDDFIRRALIEKMLDSSPNDCEIPLEDLKAAMKAAQDRQHDCLNRIELGYIKDHFDETRKEMLSGVLDSVGRELFGSFKQLQKADFGCWSDVIDAVGMRLRELKEQKKREMKGRLDSIMLTSDSVPPILTEAERLIGCGDFASAEEFMNEYVKGVTEVPESLGDDGEEDSFAEFTSDDNFGRLRELCRKNNAANKPFREYAWHWLKNHIPSGWSMRDNRDAESMLGNWPRQFGRTTGEDIKNFITGLGFSVKGAVEKTECSIRGTETFSVSLVSEQMNLLSYPHPISRFGTKLPSKLNVVVFYGGRTANDIADTIPKLKFSQNSVTIALIDFPLELAVRRQAACRFRKQFAQNTFLLIDQILALFLAAHVRADRMRVMLKCALPYSYLNPFTNGSGDTPDDMFFGRGKELSDIMNMDGTCIVYGGRQLGKTALLARAESLMMNQQEKVFAVRCSLLEKDNEAAVVESIVETFKLKQLTLDFSGCSSIRELCAQISKLTADGKIDIMLLMLDEADAFLNGISKDAYIQLQPLVDLMRTLRGRFKFVLAGLHNVIRAKNASTSNNILAQLGTSLCIKPMLPKDAMRLIMRPLKYLGFRFDNADDLRLILIKSNYYPGILQLFGHELVKTLSSDLYNENNCPPFRLNTDSLSEIMNSNEIMKHIKRMLRISLEVESVNPAEQRYFMLARCIVFRYITEADELVSGCTVDNIMKAAEYSGITCLTDKSESEIRVLLDEMVDMGILNRQEGELGSRARYRLRRNSFKYLISENPESIDEDIDRANRGESV